MCKSSVGELAQWACVAEVCAPKAGNVHPQASFEDVSWIDFITSAIVIRPILDRAALRGVGQTVLDCISTTHESVGTNTNLGIVLLLVPLCAAASNEAVVEVLQALTQEDARLVYEAINLAGPGGLGQVRSWDMADEPPANLLDAMGQAADRDAVARQYVSGFCDVRGTIAPRLVEMTRQKPGAAALDDAIVQVHLEQMARDPDSLIRRKCGDAVAAQSQRGAQEVLAKRAALQDFDAWLRCDGHRRNPGASADLVTAGLFVALQNGDLQAPFNWSKPLSS